MDEETSLLLKQYCEYHSNNANGIAEEELVEQSRVHLSSVKPKYRFMILNSHSYKDVLEKVATDLERKEESFKKIQSGFKSLEQYGLNLWKFPWRKEYHTIKLYTAFFKCNVEQQLQDTEAIFGILESLGYTERGQQEVSITEPNRERAIYISFELFLVQVDLQMIKEIIDHFPEGEVTLKDIIDARSRQHDIEGAINYLKVVKAPKRRKVEESQDNAPSHLHAKSAHTGRFDNFNNVHSNSTPFDGEASADQTTGRKPKSSMLSKGKDGVAADTYGSCGSTVSERKPSGGTPAEYQVSCIDGRFYSINSQQLTDRDLYGVSSEGSQTNGATQDNVDARYGTFPQAGSSCTSKQRNCYTGHSTVSQGGSPYEYQRNLNENHSTFPQSRSLHEAKRHHQDAQYKTVPLTGPFHYSDNTEGSQHHHTVLHTGKPFNPDVTKDRMDSVLTTSRSAAHNETATPSHITSQHSSERYAGYLRDDQKRHAVVTQSSAVLLSSKVLLDSNGYHSTNSLRTDTRVNVSASPGDARYANIQDISGFSGQTFIPNESDKRMFTKENARGNDHRDALMEVEQTEHSRLSPNDATSLRNGMAGGTYEKTPVQSRVTDLNATLKHQLTIESNFRLAGEESKQASSMSSERRRQFDSERVAGAQSIRSRAGAAGRAQPTRCLPVATSKSGSSAADLKDLSTAKTEPKDSSPGPFWRAQQDQTSGTSSENDPLNGISRERSLPERGTKAAAICRHCELQGTVICKNCLQIVCRKCEKVYAPDLCEATKGQHTFTKLTDDKIPQKTSNDSKAYSSQESANTNKACGVGELNWSCSRCTFLNPLEHRICVICGATRGIGVVEEAKPGSKVCRNCTLHNEETATVCKACDHPLSKSETIV